MYNDSIEAYISIRPMINTPIDQADMAELEKVLAIVARGLGYEIQAGCKRKCTQDDLHDSFYSWLVWHEREQEAVAWSYFDGDGDIQETMSKVYSRYVQSVEKPQPYAEAMRLIEDMVETYGTWAFRYAWVDISRPKDQWGKPLSD